MARLPVNCLTFNCFLDMKDFPFSVEVLLGYHCCGRGEYAEGFGTVSLEDEQVDQLVALIRESGLKTDIDELGVKEKLPEVYDALDCAYSDAAEEAFYSHTIIAGYYNGDFDEPEELMQNVEMDGLFKFETEEEFPDEASYQDAKDEAFLEWKDAYLDSLDDDKKMAFILKYYPSASEGDGDGLYDYEVEIPQGIIALARGEGA